MKTLLTIPEDALCVEHGISGPVWLEKSGIMITVNKGEPEHTLEHAKGQMAAYDKIAKEIPYPLIVDVTLVKSISRDAREYYSSAENAGKLKAMAIVTGSGIGRFVGNFFIRLGGSKVPSRIFTDVEEAKSWILQFV